MKRFALLSLGLIMAISISQAQKVTVDFDKAADFTQYKTFVYLGWQEDSDKILNDLDKKRVIDAFGNEMDKRDLTMVEDNPDMAVALFIVVDEKTSTTAYTNYYGGGAGRGYYRGGGGWGWGNGSSTTTYSENDYLQGTLVFSVFDAESKNLVWQGVATKTITENPKKREKNIPKVVTKLMKKFPVMPVE
jgi:hypothetical protein